VYIRQETLIFSIRLRADGINSGRSAILKAATVHEMREWMQAINLQVQQAKKLALAQKSCINEVQDRASALYHSNTVQCIMAIGIVSSYLVSIANAQLVPPKGSRQELQMKQIEIFFTVFFMIELALNMLGSWMKVFLQDPWNVFDAIVVLFSVAALVPSLRLPGVSVLRLLRVLKMVRLFKTLKHLRILINALCASIKPVLYSFTILLLISSLFAILATELFGDQGDSEEFGSFEQSLFTLFHMSTGDSWSFLVRKLMHAQETARGSAVVAIFFVSYMLVAYVVLMNIGLFCYGNKSVLY